MRPNLDRHKLLTPARSLPSHNSVVSITATSGAPPEIAPLTAWTWMGCPGPAPWRKPCHHYIQNRLRSPALPNSTDEDTGPTPLVKHHPMAWHARNIPAPWARGLREPQSTNATCQQEKPENWQKTAWGSTSTIAARGRSAISWGGGWSTTWLNISTRGRVEFVAICHPGRAERR